MIRYSMRTALLVAALMLTLLLAACGSGGDAEPTPFPTPTPLPAVVEAAPTEAAPTEAAPTEAPAAEEPAAEEPAAEATPAQPESPLSPLQTPTPAPAPTAITEGVSVSPGMAAVVGRALDAESGLPIIASDIRLAEVYCPEDVKEEEKHEKCFWTIDDARSPYTQTMADGVFKFLDVEAREYALLLGSVMGSYGLSEGADGKAVIYTLPADEILEVGEIRFRTDQGTGAASPMTP